MTSCDHLQKHNTERKESVVSTPYTTIIFEKIPIMNCISGQTPNELLMQVRLKRAAWLLRYNPELNVSQIAESVGFCSSRYFSRCFKEYYQASPQSYRKGESAEEELDEGVEHTT